MCVVEQFGVTEVSENRDFAGTSRSDKLVCHPTVSSHHSYRLQTHRTLESAQTVRSIDAYKKIH